MHMAVASVQHLPLHPKHKAMGKKVSTICNNQMEQWQSTMHV